MFRPARLLIPLLASSLLAFGTEAGLYRWVDDEGNVHYTDIIPPSQITKGHTELTEEGVRIKTVPPAKTTEEIQKEKELERLRAQQERIIEQQKAADRVLLQTFRSEDDIKMARDGKLASIDVMIRVTKNDIRRQQEWLSRLRTEAANLERSGKRIPKQLSDSISSSERSIRDAYGAIADREEQKKAIRDSFERDLDRFRQLRNLNKPPKPEQEDAPRPALHNIVTCGDAAECDRLWEKAVAYVRQQATTGVQTSGPNVLITAPPTTGGEISLILSRINDEVGDGASLFLDLQCQSSLRGEKTCQSQRARDIILGFHPALTTQDTSD
jgi:hypothetical protein